MSTPPPSVMTRIYVLSVVLGSGGVLATLLLPDLASSTRPAAWWVLPIIGIAYAVAERNVFHIEFRREAISFSLSEVPTAFALVYLAPGPAIAARMVAGLTTIVLMQRRRSSYKLFFNAALFVAESAFAFHIVRLIVARWPASDATLLIALVPATALATVGGSVFVATAIAMVEGSFKERLFGELRLMVWMAPISALVAAAAVAPTLISPWLAVLSAAPLVAVWALMRSYGRLEQRFRDLDDLHGFVGRVGISLDLAEVMEAAAADIATLLRVRRATVVVFDSEHPLSISVGEPLPDLPVAIDDVRWVDLLGLRKAQQLDAAALARWASTASSASATCSARRCETATASSACSSSPNARALAGTSATSMWFACRRWPSRSRRTCARRCCTTASSSRRGTTRSPGFPIARRSNARSMPSSAAGNRMPTAS